VADLEAEVHRLEKRLAEVEDDLQNASATQDLARIERLGTEYASTQRALEHAMETWAELAEA
jgi:hypothetical protein